jgi:threonine 3-dehydrogenase
LATFFITGGCGFLGQWLAKSIVDSGDEVVLYDVRKNLSILGQDEKKVVFHKGGIEQTEELVRAFKLYEPSVLVHYAALLSAAAEVDPAKGYLVNISSLWSLFDAARRADVREVLFASSTLAYGDDNAPTMKEFVYSPPVTLYGVSKIYAEMLGNWYHRKYGIGFAALRYASIIGPGRRDGGATAYATLIFQRAAQEEPYVVRVPEQARVPIVYVKDAVDATLAVRKKMSSLKERIFNVVGLRRNPTARELVTSVKKLIPDARITFEPEEEMNRMIASSRRNMDMTRLTELGWKPRFGNLDRLVSDFVGEVRTHPQQYRV